MQLMIDLDRRLVMKDTVFLEDRKSGKLCEAHLLPWSSNIDQIQISDHFHLKRI